MRVIYPFTQIFPEAIAALEAEQMPYEMVDVSADAEAYYRLWADLWRSGDDFTIVEHDMVVPPGSLERLRTCECEWGGHGYWLYGAAGCWFGVVRFRGSLTRRHPDLPDLIQTRDWHALDSAVINHLRLLGYPEAHWHEPWAEHLRPKHLPGMGVTLFIQCSGCGKALDGDQIQTSPHVRCQSCGLEVDMPMPKQTATDNVL